MRVMGETASALPAAPGPMAGSLAGRGTGKKSQKRWRETEADDYARVVRILAEDLADYQPPHKRVRFSIGTGNIPNSESNSCFRSIRVPSTPTTDN